MDIELKNYTVLKPQDGMWLYNRSQKLISDKVYIPGDNNGSGREEITEDQKKILETQWRKEIEQDAQESAQNLD